jgi:phytoene synthase
VAGVVGLMMTHVLGYTDPSAFVYAEKLGIAMQLTNIIRDIKEDKERGRIYLPLEELKEFGLSEEDIIKERWSENMREFIKYQVQRARKYYEDASYGISLLEPESRFAIVSAMKIYGGILSKIEENDHNPFNQRVFVPTSEKIKILIKEFLRYKIVNFKNKNSQKLWS